MFTIGAGLEQGVDAREGEWGRKCRDTGVFGSRVNAVGTFNEVAGRVGVCGTCWR